METKLKFLSAKVKQFYFWKWAIPINLMVYIILFVIQVTLIFGFGMWGIAPIRPNEEHVPWLLIVQTAAALVSITATIYTIRLKRRYFYFNTMSMILFLFNNIMQGLFVNGIKIFLLWFPLIVRYVRWSDKSDKGKINRIPRRLKLQYFVGIAIFYLGLSAGFGFLIANVFEKESKPFLDCAAFVFSLGGAFLEMYGIIEGFVFSLVGAILILVMWIQLHSYTMIVTQTVWIISLVGTILSWLAIYYENYGTFKHVKPGKDLILINQLLIKH